MTTHRLIPPANGAKVTVNGRTFDPTHGAQDIPDYDSNQLQANGWLFVAVSGPTSTRHSATVGAYALHRGVKYFDTTIGKTVTWDGANWRNESGAVA